MKFSYKIAITILLVATLSVISLIFTYDYFNHIAHEEALYGEIENRTLFISGQIDEHINELIILTSTISHIDSLKEELEVSNSEFDVLSQNDRESLITDLNNTWKDTSNIDDPFIQERMTNDIALFLGNLHDLNPELYGEAFVTNKYGVMISTTGKLTTLAHYDKYWWQGAYNEGSGVVYLDDRGYDESVDGYVLGVVVPVYDESDEIIGMLKVNFNIENILSTTMQGMNSVNGFGEFSIARSFGLIISKEGVEPLSESIDESIIPDLIKEEYSSGETILDDNEYYYSIYPIEITLDDENVIFGGSFDSVDHSLGNLGEHWSVIYFISDEDANIAVHEVLNTLIYGGVIMVILIFIVSLLVSYRLSTPLNKLKNFVIEVSEGDLSKRIHNSSSDEIGLLSNAFNDTLDNLEKTLISKDSLEKEIKEKEVLEQKLIELSRIDVLTKIYNRRAFNDFYNSYYERAIRYKEHLGVIIFDIDDFKLVNDNFGHLVGDSVLIKLSEEIKKLVRISDIFARWGGEEFIILVPSTKCLQVLELSERIRKHFEKIDFGLEKSITISLGIGMMKSKDSKDDLLNKADKALYQAKSEGKNKSVVIK